MKPLTRRTILRGVLSTGTRISIGLPLLEAMLSENGTVLAQSGEPIPPVYVTWFFGNGVLPGLWRPSETGRGSEWALSPQLQALAAVKSELTVVSGLVCKINGTAHATGAAGATTGAPLNGAAVSAPSIDQLVADTIAGDAPFRSLELGVSPASPLSDIHSTHTVSHNGPNSRNDADFDSRSVFNRLFGGSVSQVEASQLAVVRKSVLDAVLADGRRLQRRLGSQDRQRLEAHLEAVRAIELRIEEQEISSSAPDTPVPSSPLVGPDELHEAPPAVHSVMTELATLALATGKTQVMSYMFTLPAAHVYFRHLGSEMDDDFHNTICHGDLGTPSDQPRADAGIRYTMRCLNEFATSLKNTPHGAGNLLDAALIYVTSCVSWGRTHDHSEWPALLIGKANGHLAGDAHHRFEEENLSRLLLTILQGVGSEQQTLGMEAGFTDQPLPNIFT